MKTEIIQLDIKDFEKCGNIWDMKRQSALTEQIYQRLLSNNQTIYVYVLDGAFIGEVSLVKEMEDADYTISGKRIYVSRLIVKEEYRRLGIGRKLLRFAVEKAAKAGFAEMSVGVDLDNYAALRLYVQEGFDSVLFVGEDEYGRYLKLLKTVRSTL